MLVTGSCKASIEIRPERRHALTKLGGGTIFLVAFILLCHKFQYLFRAAHHGQRNSIVARASPSHCCDRVRNVAFRPQWRISGLVTLA